MFPEAAKIDWGKRLRIANNKTIANDLINDPPVFDSIRNYSFDSLFPALVTDPTASDIRKTTVPIYPILVAPIVNLSIRSSPKEPIPPQNKAIVKNAVDNSIFSFW